MVKGQPRYQSSKLEVEECICWLCLAQTDASGVARVGRYSFQLLTLTSDIFAAPWPKSMFSTSFKRSNTYIPVWSQMPKAIAWVLRYVILVQIDPIDKGVMNQGCVIVKALLYLQTWRIDFSYLFFSLLSLIFENDPFCFNHINIFYW